MVLLYIANVGNPLVYLLNVCLGRFSVLSAAMHVN